MLRKDSKNSHLGKKPKDKKQFLKKRESERETQRKVLKYGRENKEREQSPNQQNPKTPRSSMLRADHPQTPIRMDSGQESWDRLRKKENVFEDRLGKNCQDSGLRKKVILSQEPELTTATDEVEHWDPDRTYRRLLAR